MEAALPYPQPQPESPAILAHSAASEVTIFPHLSVLVWFHYGSNFYFPDSHQNLTSFYMLIDPCALPAHINNFLRLFVTFKSMLGDFMDGDGNLLWDVL